MMIDRRSHSLVCRYAWLLAAALALVCVPAYAEDNIEASESAATAESTAETQDESDRPDEDVIDLGTLYVEETLLQTEDVLDRPTAAATVLDPLVLSRRALTLAEALDSVPGVSVRSFGGLGALSTISIRGLGSENVLVLLDGIPLNPTGGTVDLSDIPLDSLERIEILRGGEGAYSGGGAVGGVVRLVSRAPERDGETHRAGRLSAGSFGTLTSGFTWRAPGNIFHLERATSGGQFRFRNDNGTSFDASDDFVDCRENNEFAALDARYGHSWELSETQGLGFSLEWHRAEKGIPGITTFPSPHASQTDSRIFLHAAYEDSGFDNGEVALSFSWLRQGRHFLDPLGESTGVPLETSWIHSRWDAKCEWTGMGWGEDDVLTWGASLVLERLMQEDYGNPSRDTVAMWLRDEWYLPSGAVITSAGRCDWIDGQPTLSPRAGLRCPISGSVVARANLGLDFRPPSFEELYRNEGLVVGNEDLTNERTLGFDIGLVHTSESLRAEVTYFNLQTRDLIDYLLISGFRWKPYNIGRTRSSGFELSADWLIAPGWEFRTTCTRTKAIDTSGDPTRQGQPLVGQPSSDLYTQLRWHVSPWEVFGEWERRGPSPITPSGTRFLAPNDAMNVGVGYSFPDGSTVLMEIKNLLGENLKDVRGFPLPGTSLFLTITGEW